MARNAIGFYNNVAVTGQYTISSSALEEARRIEALVYYIVRNIILRHPSMTVGVVNGDKKDASWKRLARIDLSEVVQFVAFDDMSHFLEQGHSKPFDRVSELPLWRVVIGRPTSVPEPLPDHESLTLIVGFFFHHAIGDGGSGAAFHMDFSELLNAGKFDAAANLSTNKIVELPAATLLPSLE